MVGPYSFTGKGLTSVVIPDECTDIYYGAFEGCTSLTEVTIGTGAAEIADGAFLGCSALATVNYNAINATTDNSYGFGGVFGDCSALTTLNFGSAVQSIDNDIFFSLNNSATLTHINIAAERLLTISTSTFGYGQSGVAVKVPCSQLQAYQNDSVWSTLGAISADCGGDTAGVNDTTIVGDTVHVTVYDTVHVTIYDTVVSYVDSVYCDTLTVHDTVYVGTQSIIQTGENTVKVYIEEGRIVAEGTSWGETVSLLDMQGRLVREAFASNKRTYLERPAAGVYLLRAGARAAHKIVVR